MNEDNPSERAKENRVTSICCFREAVVTLEEQKHLACWLKGSFFFHVCVNELSDGLLRWLGNFFLPKAKRYPQEKNMHSADLDAAFDCLATKRPRLSLSVTDVGRSIVQVRFVLPAPASRQAGAPTVAVSKDSTVEALHCELQRETARTTDGAAVDLSSFYLFWVESDFDCCWGPIGTIVQSAHPLFRDAQLSTVGELMPQSAASPPPMRDCEVRYCCGHTVLRLLLTSMPG